MVLSEAVVAVDTLRDEGAPAAAAWDSNKQKNTDKYQQQRRQPSASRDNEHNILPHVCMCVTCLSVNCCRRQERADTQY